MAAGLDAAGAVQQLERRRARWKNTVADEKRAVVERDVLVRGCAEGRVIKVKCAAGDFDARIAVALEKDVSNPCLGRTGSSVDG